MLDTVDEFQVGALHRGKTTGEVFDMISVQNLGYFWFWTLELICANFQCNAPTDKKVAALHKWIELISDPDANISHELGNNFIRFGTDLNMSKI